MTKQNDKGERVYRKLLYFFENKINVHFKLETGEFRNGSIIDLSELKYTLVLVERMMGEIPLLLEDIKENSICKMEERV